MYKRQWWLSSLIGTMTLWSGLVMADTSNTVEYSGTLIALPCTVQPGMDDFHIEMDEVFPQNLYTQGRTAGQEFSFVLEDCDPSLGSTITATFTGVSNGQGLLEFDSTSSASGALIGVETLSGTPLLIDGVTSYSTPIADGNMTLKFRAYVQGDSAAIAAKNITPGLFWATLTYALSYE